MLNSSFFLTQVIRNQNLNILLCNSIHAIRYLWLHKFNKTNYFLHDGKIILSKIYLLFSILREADDNFNLIDQVLKNLKLNDDEYSLLELLIILSYRPNQQDVYRFFYGMSITDKLISKHNFTDVSETIQLIKQFQFLQGILQEFLNNSRLNSLGDYNGLVYESSGFHMFHLF